MGGAGCKQSSTYKYNHSHASHEEDEKTQSRNITKSKYSTAISHRPLSVSSGSVPSSEAELPLVVSSIGYELNRKIGDGAFSK